MRTKTILLMLIFAVCLVRGPTLSGKSVRFVRAVHLQSKSQGKTLQSFLLGKKKQKKINPASICRIGQDRLCATDAVNGSVIIFDNNGTIKKEITHVKGYKIVSPVCACVDDRGNLYVSDSARSIVLKFDQKQKFERVFISLPPDRSRITGITFHHGIFYCVDTANHLILCFDRGGTQKFSFGKRGGGEGEFNFPTHITADNHCVYVTDAMNFRIQVFDHSGKFIRTFGTNGRGGGNFSKPKGIAVDREQRIFAADAMFDNVQIFSSSGRFLYYFGGPGHGEGEFWMPAGIMIDHDNTIWVADTYNNRIQVFKLVENES